MSRSTATSRPSYDRRPMDKENGYIFEDVAEDDDDDYGEEETATDFIVDNFRIANDVFRRQSQSSYASGAGGSVMTSNSTNIISQYSVKNTRKQSISKNYKNSISNNSNASSKNSNENTKNTTSSLEEYYSNKMDRMSRGGDYYFEPISASRTNHRQSSSSSSSGRGSDSSGRPPMQPRNGEDEVNTASDGSSGRNSSGSLKKNRTKSSSKSFVPPTRCLPSHKLPASDRDPSEEILALFGVHGMTGHHFLQLALEAGYKQVRCLVLPGMTEQGFAEDFGGVDNLPPNLKLIVGTIDDTEKVKRVVKNASYVVCLFHDAERPIEHPEGGTNMSTSVGSSSSSSNRTKDELPPLHTYYDRSQQRDSTGSANSNGTDTSSSSSSGKSYPHLKFMETLLPLLHNDDVEGNGRNESQSKCRVLLYQASSSSIDERGNAPIIGQVVKKLQFSKIKRQQLKEQDRIVKYIAETARDKPFNFIVTRPGDLVRDRPSRKKLSASKSVRFFVELWIRFLCHRGKA
jgi:hypothetical protein